MHGKAEQCSTAQMDQNRNGAWQEAQQHSTGEKSDLYFNCAITTQHSISEPPVSYFQNVGTNNIRSPCLRGRREDGKR